MACHSARIRAIREALQLTLIACTAAGKTESGVSARKLCACARMTNSCHKRWQIAAARKRNLSRFRTASARARSRIIRKLESKRRDIDLEFRG